MTALSAGVPWTDPAPRAHEVEVERDVAARMRDGAVLLADVYRPACPPPWPVLLMRLPYDKAQAEVYAYSHPSWYARAGYLVVVQDCRGRWASEGEWYPFRDEAADGFDTVAWAAALPGSSGQVAMYGFSYAGATQLLAAGERPPALAAIAPAMTAADYYDQWTYRGGALQHAFTRFWALSLARDTARRRGDLDLEERLAAALRRACEEYWAPPAAAPLLVESGVAPYYRDWIAHDTADDYWHQWSIRSRPQSIAVPALYVGGWYDVFLEGTLDSFGALGPGNSARPEQRLVVGPWFHSPWHQHAGGFDFGAAAGSAVDALHVLWLDRHLRGERNQLDDEPPVALFVMGENRWRFESSWPVAGIRAQTFFLRSGGRANSLAGNGWLALERPDEEPPDVFVYDPRNPVLSLGGHSCCNDMLAPMGPADQRPAEVRNDVLVYTSAVLSADVVVIGTVELTLFAASTAVDTDFTAKLVDVHPDGRAVNIADGIVRARFRDSLAAPSLLQRDRVTEYRIRVGSTANRFASGHRIRLEVSSSNFPAFDRNSNSGKPLIEAGPADWVVATQTVFHDHRYPSRLTLPVACS